MEHIVKEHEPELLKREYGKQAWYAKLEEDQQELVDEIMEEIDSPFVTMSDDEEGNPVLDKWYGVDDNENFPTKQDLAKLGLVGEAKAKDLLAKKLDVMALVEKKQKEKDSDSD